MNKKYIMIEPTNKCMLNCVMCPRKEINENLGFMNIDDYTKLLQHNDDIETIRFQGLGEPLLHPDIFNMLEMAKQYSIYTSMCTNLHTIKFDDNYAEEFLCYVDELDISCDGILGDYNRIRKWGNFTLFDYHMNLISKYKYQENKIYLSIVTSKENMNQSVLLRTLDYALKHKCDGIKLQIIQQWDTNENHQRTREVDEITPSTKDLIKMCSDAMYWVYLHTGLKDYITINTHGFENTIDCTWGIDKLYIKWDNTIGTCNMRPSNKYDLYKNIDLSNIHDIIKEEEVKNNKTYNNTCLDCPQLIINDIIKSINPEFIFNGLTLQ